MIRCYKCANTIDSSPDSVDSGTIACAACLPAYVDPTTIPGTYAAVLYQYASMVKDGTTDSDLSAGERAWCATLVRCAARGVGTVTVRARNAQFTPYPPTSADRDACVREVHDYLCRTYANPDTFGISLQGWDRGIARAIAIVRGV